LDVQEPNHRQKKGLYTLSIFFKPHPPSFVALIVLVIHGLNNWQQQSLLRPKHAAPSYWNHCSKDFLCKDLKHLTYLELIALIGALASFPQPNLKLLQLWACHRSSRAPYHTNSISRNQTNWTCGWSANMSEFKCKSM